MAKATRLLNRSQDSQSTVSVNSTISKVSHKESNFSTLSKPKKIPLTSIKPKVGSELVVVQSKKDGFFYEGYRDASQQFSSKGQQVHIPATKEKIFTKDIIQVVGAIARPPLNINDTVLVKKEVDEIERPDLATRNIEGVKVFAYLPGIVLNNKHGWVTVYVMDKEVVVARRKFVIKAPKQIYFKAVAGIKVFGDGIWGNRKK